jgi:predicted NBD/HSP70 family sugar kinase
VISAVKRTSRDIRVANRFDVLRQIIAHPGVSRQEIAVETDLSLATVSNLVGELLETRLVVEIGYQDSGGGRPRALVSVNPAGGVLVGLDVAETYVHAELFDPALTVLATVQAQLDPAENRPEQVVSHIVSTVHAALAERPGGGRVLGVGVSVPGQVDHEGGVSVFAPNWDWHDVPLRSLLADRLSMPLYLDSPLRAGVVGELWFGAGRGCEDVVALTLGTGVGAGFAFGGTLHRGATNSSGEWGHTNLVPGGRSCRCGLSGCIEAYIGAPGIMEHLREADPDSPMLYDGDQTATIEALANGVAAGDPVAAAVVRRTAEYLGVAIANLINLLNPQVIALNSWVAARLGQLMLADIRAVAAEHTLRRPAAAAVITLAQTTGNPVSLGSAAFALEGFLARIGAPAGRPARPQRALAPVSRP